MTRMNGYGKRVLIVEDNEDARNLLGLTLVNAGYSVHVACDGHQALEEMKRRRFDVVVTDHHMPHVNGFQLILLGRLVWPETPMILLSGDDASLVEMAQQGGAYGCLYKPYDSDKLLELMEAVIQSAHEQRSQATESMSLSS